MASIQGIKNGMQKDRQQQQRPLYFMMLKALLLLLLPPGSLAVAVDWANLHSDAGDGLPDFSYCGYHSSDDALPGTSSTPTQTLQPGSGDRASAIQSALNSISSSGGGVLMLAQGNYTVGSSIIMPANTVLRGAGIGKTYLLPTSGANDFIVFGSDAAAPTVNVVTDITDTYVRVGASSFTVSSTSGLAVGIDIMVQREVTDAWIAANGMNTLVRNGAKQTWLAAGELVQQPRKIKAISGNKITVDVPLTDSINNKNMAGKVAKYTFPSAASEIGVENLNVVLSPSCNGKSITDTTCNGRTFTISAYVTDSWIRNVDITGFNQFITAEAGSQRITIDTVSMHRTGVSDGSSGWPADIGLLGQQYLITGCSTYAASADMKTFPVVTQKLTPGPNAVLNYYSQQAAFSTAPHQRWAHGFLVENSRSTIDFENRGTAGTGQGWSIANGVAWNMKGSDLDVYSPATATNWCIGCQGTRTAGNGTFISRGDASVTPSSLFSAQLAARK